MKYSDIKILPGVSVRLTLLALLFLGRLLLSFYEMNYEMNVALSINRIVEPHV